MMNEFSENKVGQFAYALRKGTGSGAPLVVMLHGKAGKLYTMQPFFSSVSAASDLLVIQAPLPDALGGYSWWDYDPNSEDSAAQWQKASPVASQLTQSVEQIITQQQLTPSAVVGVGFSQGGGLLSVCIQQNSSPFSRVALLASFVVKSPDAKDLSGKEIFWAHGNKDQRIPIEAAQFGVDLLRAQKAQVTFVTDDVGHKVGSLGMKALKIWLEQATQ